MIFDFHLQVHAEDKFDYFPHRMGNTDALTNICRNPILRLETIRLWFIVQQLPLFYKLRLAALFGALFALFATLFGVLHC